MDLDPILASIGYEEALSYYSDDNLKHRSLQTCDFCTFQSDSQTAIESHKDVHEKLKCFYRCPDCEKRMRRKLPFLKHIEKKHNISVAAALYPSKRDEPILKQWKEEGLKRYMLMMTEKDFEK